MKCLWFIFIINLCRQFFAVFERNVLDPNWPYISTFQTILIIVCLSVIVEFCLSSSIVLACVLAPAYTSLCRGMEYLLKVRYIIVVDPNRSGFWFSRQFFWAEWQHSPIYLKNTSQKWATFVFGSTYCHQTFLEWVCSQFTHFGIFSCQM